jgi:hypothetical protein
LLGRKEEINVGLFIRCFVCLLICLLVDLNIVWFVSLFVGLLLQCSDAMSGFVEVTSHGCMVSSLAQRLLRMDQAPGFGRSSRIAIGKEAAGAGFKISNKQEMLV